MSSIGNRWMSYLPAPKQSDVIQLAIDTDRTIQARPSTIVITRDDGNGVVITLHPQVVRIEVVQNIRGTSEQRDAMVATTKQYTVILGYKDHPTIPNTDIRRADTFFYKPSDQANARQYEVVEYIDTVPGRLLMSCELTP